MCDTGNARDGSPDNHTSWEVERRLANIVQEHITVRGRIGDGEIMFSGDELGRNVRRNLHENISNV